jgi:hypothetical protein
MAGYLINPQVQVKWGDRNLSAYTLPESKSPQAIVFNTKVDISGGSWPTGSFSWNPTGPAFKVYEECVTKGRNEIITIRFYYVNGPYVLFKFQYNGSSINYGKDMSIEVSLSCEQSGKSNGVRASAMDDYTDGRFNAKGKDLYVAAKDIQKAFGNPVPVLWSQASKIDAKKIFLASWQFKDQTFGAEILNIAAQAGQSVTLNNMFTSGQAALFPPLSKEGKDKVDSVKFPPGPGETVKADQRYGYLLGPGIISSFQRSMEYPPQTKGQNSITQPTGTPNKSKTINAPGSQPLSTQQQQDEAQKLAKKNAVANPSSPTVVKQNKFTKNDVGPENQQLMQQEEGVKFQAVIFMCPLMVGIKPEDVIYIASLKTGDKLIEDYKVKSVSYAQDGGMVNVNVSACRTAGLDHPMNEEAAKKFMEKADGLKTIEDWTNYAWKERLKQ